MSGFSGKADIARSNCYVPFGAKRTLGQAFGLLLPEGV
jgi:hypothetical protein